MLVKDFITKELPVLKSFDTGEYALALMDDFKLKHLPLLSENIYRCLVSEKDLLAMPDPTAIIGDPVLFSPSVQEDTHIYEALALVTRYQLSLLPVVSTEGEYRGVITRDKLIEYPVRALQCRYGRKCFCAGSDAAGLFDDGYRPFDRGE